MNFTVKAASTFLLLAMASTAIPQSEPLGRLFFTPEQRAVLDRQRQSNMSPDAKAFDEGAAYTVNGLVRHSSGRQTIWINGIPVDNADSLVGHDRPLRAGETVRAGTGQRTDVLNGGQITVRRPPQTSAQQ